MTNVTLFNGNAPLPAHLAEAGVDDVTKKLLGNRAGGLRISIKGGVWRMLNNSEEIMRNENRALNVVVVNAAADNARTYYKDKFNEDQVAPPTCWSSNGIAPEAEVKTKMSATCATCPMNVAGSGERGESRACRYSRSLAVTLENDPQGQVFKLTLPATSIFGKVENNVMPLDAYVKLLSSQRVPITGVVTELKFDTSSATPKIGFKAVRYLTSEEYAIAKEKGATPEAVEATKSTVYETDYGTNTASAAKPQPKPVANPVPHTPAEKESATEEGNEAALLAQMEALQKKLAAAKATATDAPVVMKPKGGPVEVPQSTADLLKQWDE